jgi:hypothetical protein
MSYYHFTAKATFDVAEDFDLDSFLVNASMRYPAFTKQYGFRPDNEDLSNFNDYVKQSKTRVTVRLDSEEPTFSNSDAFDWLLSQFIPVMSSRFMKVESIVIDSRHGHSCCVWYQTQGGATIHSDELIHFYLS